MLKEPKLDPRVKRTRQLLEQSFIELLEEKGFQATTVQDITQRATVNRATFYAHFEDKYALLDHVISESFHQVIRGRLEPEAEFSLDNFKTLITATCEYLDEFASRQCDTSSSRQFDPLMEKEVQSQIYRFVWRWLGELQGSRQASRSDRDALAAATSWLIFGGSHAWAQGGKQYSADEMADQILALTIGGLSDTLNIELPRSQTNIN